MDPTLLALLGIKDARISTDDIRRAVLLFPRLSIVFARNLRARAQQLETYRSLVQLRKTGSLPTSVRVSTLIMPDVIESFMLNPNLKPSVIDHIAIMGHWEHQPILLAAAGLNPSRLVKRLGVSGLKEDMATVLLMIRTDIDDVALSLIWQFSVATKNDELLRLCAGHPSASPSMIEAYFSGASIQEIELESEGIDRESIELLRDFFWF